MSSDARKPTAPVGIKDIARALGISTGTVDRALHAKPGVSAMTRARVLSMAESLGYRPNLAARYLKSQKQLRISVHLPQRNRALLGLAPRGHPPGGRAVCPGPARRLPKLSEPRRRRHPALRGRAAGGHQWIDHRAGQPRGVEAVHPQGRAKGHSRRLRDHRRARHAAAGVSLRGSVHGWCGRRRAARQIPAVRREGRVLHRLALDAGSRRQAARVRIEPRNRRRHAEAGPGRRSARRRARGASACVGACFAHIPI